MIDTTIDMMIVTMIDIRMMSITPVTITVTGNTGIVTTTPRPQADSITPVITKTQTTHQLLPLTGQIGLTTMRPTPV